MNCQSWENSMTQTLWSWWIGLSKRIFSLFKLNAIYVNLMFLVIASVLFVTGHEWSLVTHRDSCRWMGYLEVSILTAVVDSNMRRPPSLLLFSGSVSCYCTTCVPGKLLIPFAPVSTQFSQLKESFWRCQASSIIPCLPLYISSSLYWNNFLLISQSTRSHTVFVFFKKKIECLQL